jgi:hypothetical protein
MTGDIREKLLASDAVQSLRMEAKVATAFRVNGWESEQGAYYSDPTTSKIREIDVLVMKALNKGRQHTFGDPIVNFTIVCECKNLGGYSIVFNEDRRPAPSRLKYKGIMVPEYWIGSNIDPLVSKIAEYSPEISSEVLDKLSKYFEIRAFLDELNLWGNVKLLPPRVEVNSRAFRETNGNNIRDESSSVLWRSILTLLSTYKAIRLEEASRHVSDVIADNYRHSIRSIKATEIISFFYDMEVCRRSFVHMVIVVKAGLWCITADGMREIPTARVEVTNINHDSYYVDIVSESVVEEYAQHALRHFDDFARRALRAVARRIASFGWRPAQERRKLRSILVDQRRKRPPRSFPKGDDDSGP